MFKLNRHGDNTLPMHLQNCRLHKGDSSVQETQETAVNTVTFDDSSELVVDAPESKQTGVIKLSNVDAGARVDLSVTNTGLSGGDIADILEPVSSDISRGTSAVSAVSASVSDAIDGTRETFKSLFENTKKVFTEPGVQLAAGVAGLVWLNSRQQKNRKRGVKS